MHRCAKHDVTGVMPWAAHHAVITTHCMWAFDIAVGPASKVPPYGALAVNDIVVMW